MKKLHEIICKRSLLTRTLPYLFGVLGLCTWLTTPSYIGSLGGGMFFGLIMAIIVKNNSTLSNGVGFPVLLIASFLASSWKEDAFTEAVFSSGQDLVGTFSALLLCALFSYLLDPKEFTNDFKDNNKTSSPHESERPKQENVEQAPSKPATKRNKGLSPGVAAVFLGISFFSALLFFLSNTTPSLICTHKTAINHHIDDVMSYSNQNKTDGYSMFKTLTVLDKPVIKKQKNGDYLVTIDVYRPANKYIFSVDVMNSRKGYNLLDEDDVVFVKDVQKLQLTPNIFGYNTVALNNAISPKGNINNDTEVVSEVPATIALSYLNERLIGGSLAMLMMFVFLLMSMLSCIVMLEVFKPILFSLSSLFIMCFSSFYIM